MLKSNIHAFILFFVGGLFADDDTVEEISDDELENHLVSQWLSPGRKS